VHDRHRRTPGGALAGDGAQDVGVQRDDGAVAASSSTVDGHGWSPIDCGWVSSGLVIGS
jgi:hypothetical protein